MRSIRCGLAGALVLAFVVTGCSSTGATFENIDPPADANSASTEASSAPSTDAAESTDPSPAPSTGAGEPDSIVCKLTADGGSFYLRITSAAEHNFSACDGGERLPFTTDVFGLDPTMDGRCVNDDTVEIDQALIGVYSTTAPADLDAAQALCTSHGWKKRAE